MNKNSSSQRIEETPQTSLNHVLLTRKEPLTQDPSTLTDTNNLGSVLSNQWNNTEAEKIHRETWAVMNNIGSVPSNQGEHAEAEKIHRETLALREKVSGMDHALRRFIASFAPSRSDFTSEDSTIHSEDGITSDVSSAETKVGFTDDVLPKNEVASNDSTLKSIEHLRTQSLPCGAASYSTPGLSNIIDRTTVRRCADQCDCACHNHYRFCSPSILERLYGRLSMEYSGVRLFQHDKCDRPTCVGQSSTSLTYCFPLWLIARAVHMDVVSGKRRGTTISIRFSKRMSEEFGNDNGLFHYARIGDTNSIQTLFAKGIASPFSQTTSGETALHFAYAFRHLDLCRLLLDWGADYAIKDDIHRTPLHFAAYTALDNLNLPTAQISTTVKKLLDGSDVVESPELLRIREVIMDLAKFHATVEGQIQGRMDHINLGSKDMLDNDVRRALLLAASSCENTSSSSTHVPFLKVSELGGVVRDLVQRAYLDTVSALALAVTSYRTSQSRATSRASIGWTKSFGTPIGPMFNFICFILSLISVPFLESLEIGAYVVKHSLQCEKPLELGFRRVRWTCVSSALSNSRKF